MTGLACDEVIRPWSTGTNERNAPSKRFDHKLPIRFHDLSVGAVSHLLPGFDVDRIGDRSNGTVAKGGIDDARMSTAEAADIQRIDGFLFCQFDE